MHSSYNFQQNHLIQKMKKNPLLSSLIPNIFQLEQSPFLKKETSPWRRFQDKQKFLPIFRTITYQSQLFMSKIFLFDIKQQVKDNKRKRQLVVFTEKQVVNVQQLYQILNQNIDQKQFSEEVSRIKQFQKQVTRYVQAILHKNLIAFKKNEDFLTFNIYKNASEYYLKASFNNYNYKFQLTEETSTCQIPSPLRIDNIIVKQELNKRYNNQASIANSIKLDEDIMKAYKNFYDMTFFHYDQYILKLQVFENHPLLRLKNYIPIKFIDYKTQQPLEGPVFSNSEPECMFGHFIGFNADTTKTLEGDFCSTCQVPYYQFQENELLMMLRDNICNPQKNDIFYCPQFNRFKILAKTLIKQSEAGQKMVSEEPLYKTTIKYENYCHFRLNLKKITNKNRLTFYPKQVQQVFPITFNLFNRQYVIIDPARGKYCQHYTFSDLRLYYLNYDPQTKLYKCPIAGCNEQMSDNDILYLKEVQILIEYAKFKCQKNPELVNSSKIVIDHVKKKVHLTYRSKQENSIVALAKIDQIPQFYKTLADPFIPFAEYSLGIKDKQREQKMNEYMFGGWRGQMQQNIQQEQQEQQNDDD